MARRIIFEAKGIQVWITRGGRLAEVAGASVLVEELCTALVKRVLAACGHVDAAEAGLRPQQIAAGAFEIDAIEDDVAAAFLRVWPLVLSTWAPGLDYRLAVQPPMIGNGDAPAPPLPADAALRASGSILDPALPTATPITLRAPRTGSSAAERVPVATDQDELLDAVSARQHYARGRAFQALGHAGQSFAADMESIAEEDPNGYVAVVHADGNDLGRFFQEIRSHVDEATGAKLSTGFQRAVRVAVQQALDEVFGADRKKLPARPVVVAGDDVTLVLPARCAPWFTETFLERFEAETGRLLEDQRTVKADGWPSEVTAAAGIAAVHAHHPFTRAHGLALDLCKFAKGEADLFRAELLNSSPAFLCRPSVLAFHRLTASFSGTYAELLERELVVEDFQHRWLTQETDLRLTMNPYVLGSRAHGSRLPSFSALRKLRRALETVPTGSWREVAELLYSDGRRAQDRFERLLIILGDQDAEEREDLHKALLALDCVEGSFLVERDRPGRHQPELVLPVLDARTLFELEKGGRGP